MGWFSQKREIAELRKQVAQLTHAFNQSHQPAGPDPSRILEVLLEGQVKQVDSFGGFIRMISDVAAERMGSALGRRGGRKRAATAQRDAKGRMLPGRAARAAAGDCILCDDPTAANFTTQEFEEHQKHKNRPRRVEAERIEPTAEEREVIEREPIRQQPDYPLPRVAYPLVPAPPGDEADRPSGDTAAGDHEGTGTRNGVA